MRSERGQATVEWVGLMLLVALVLGFAVTRAREAGKDEREVGDLLAQRIARGGAVGQSGSLGQSGTLGQRGTLGQGGTTDPGERAVSAPVPREAGAAAPLVPLRGRELLRAGTRRVVAANGLVCYVRKSTAGDDTNRVADDIGDAVNCLNPVGGWTGDVGGTDG